MGSSSSPSVVSASNRPLDWVLTEICGHLAADLAELEAKASEHERLEDEASEALGDIRRRVRQLGARHETWWWVPFHGRRLARDLQAARARASSVRAELLALRRATDETRKRIAQASLSYEMLLMLGQRDYCVPDPMPARTQRFLRRFEEARRQERLRSQIHKFAGDVSEILGDWAAASLLFLQRRDGAASSEEHGQEERETSLVFDKGRGVYVETTGGYVRRSATTHSLHRIYLPIPRAWEAKAVAAGARIDDSTVNHVMSRVWVSFHEYESFEEYTPLVYRKTPPELDFEELHLQFGGKEFSFAAEQRALLRKDMEAKQGSRCVLCGSYGGLVWDWVKDARSDMSLEPLTFRFQWRYRRHHDTDVGVAELADLLLICRDCDIAFHESRLRQLVANKDPKLADRALSHLHKRRLMLSRCESETLAVRQKEMAEHLARMAGMSSWVVDLESMVRRFPVLGDGVIADETLPLSGAPIISSAGEVLVPARSVDMVAEGLSRQPEVLNGPEPGQGPSFIAPERDVSDQTVIPIARFRS